MTDDVPLSEVVRDLEALCRRRREQGNAYVKTRHAKRRFDYDARRIGLAMSRLVEDGLLERYNQSSAGTVWRLTDALEGEPPDGGEVEA